MSRLQWLGFHDAASTALSDIVKQSTSNFDSKRILGTVEPSFDETDELALKCSHYTVAEGKNFNSTNTLHWLHSYSRSLTGFNQRPKLPVKARLFPKELRRSGHICAFKAKTIHDYSQVKWDGLSLAFFYCFQALIEN